MIINLEIRFILHIFASNKREIEMEKTFTIHYGYQNGNSRYHYKVRIMCEESKVKEISKAVANGERVDWCYVEGENYRLTICDCM